MFINFLENDETSDKHVLEIIFIYVGMSNMYRT